jgi:ubiquinone/menaquinone biosynthesis C-methylase UbiE
VNARDGGASFDRVAPFYESLERFAFGDSLQRARVAFLEQVHGKRALIVGEGNGRFLAELLRRNSEITVDCVDASARMLRLAKRRAKDSAIRSGRDGDDTTPGRIRFHCADFTRWQAANSRYDLIVTHFFLDCFNREELTNVVAKIASLAAPHARWLISDFQIPAGVFPRLHALAWLRAMYAFFRYAARLRTRALVDFAPLLRAHHFNLTARCDSRFGLVTAQSWER